MKSNIMTINHKQKDSLRDFVPFLNLNRSVINNLALG